MKTQYRVEATSPTDDSFVVIEIDDAHPEVDKAIKEAVDFWGGPENRRYDENGEYERVFVKQLASKLFEMYNNIPMIRERLMCAIEQEEGYFPIDGSYGVSLVNCEIEDRDFESEIVQTITNP